jgi:hypothetical protein
MDVYVYMIYNADWGEWAWTGFIWLRISRAARLL